MASGALCCDGCGEGSCPSSAEAILAHIVWSWLRPQLQFIAYVYAILEWKLQYVSSVTHPRTHEAVRSALGERVWSGHCDLIACARVIVKVDPEPMSLLATTSHFMASASRF